MLKEMAGRDGLYAQFLRTPKVLDVVRDDEAASGRDRTFQHHVVAGIAQERADERRNGLPPSCTTRSGCGAGNDAWSPN